MSVMIHGKEYKTVAERVNEFRTLHPDWTIQSMIFSIDNDRVVMRTDILDDTGRIISTGYAEEVRTASKINRTSALENCETSSVGRALAFFGLAGSEIASANEVQGAISQKLSFSKATPEQIVTLENYAGAENDAEKAKWINQRIKAGLTEDEALTIIEKIRVSHGK